MSFSRVLVKRRLCRFGGHELAHGLALELEAVGVVDDAIEDGVGDRRLADQVMPFVDRNLGGDRGGFAAIAFLGDFQ